MSNVIYIERKCYTCDLDLSQLKFGDDWEWVPIDGGQHPQCWNCQEKMYEYAQDAMYQDREQTHPEEF